VPVLSAEEILKATGGAPLRGGRGWSCRGISTDTRTLTAGNLFIALAGENFDGHGCLTQAAERGAAGLVIRADAAEKLAAAPEEMPAIGVPDTLRALGGIAGDWRRRYPVPLVAITGSSGKTTTKEMVATIAARMRNILKTEGNLNNRIGLPLTLLKLREEHELAIVEMGSNTPGEIAALAVIAAPDVGLITNIGPAHLEGLGSLEAIREEKGSLFEIMAGRGTAILNHDDPAIGLLAKRWRGKRISFGLSPGAGVTARRIEPAGPQGVRFNLVIDGIGTPVFLAAAGEHNVINALAAAAASWALGLDRHVIAAGLAAFRPIPGRTEIRQLGNGAFLIIDAYNANPASVREAIKTLQGLRGSGGAVAILGDMLELGKQSEALHEEIGTLLADANIHDLFLRGSLTEALAAGAIRRGFPAERITFFEDPEEVVSSLRPRLKKDDWILIKGSRMMKMEAVAEKIIAAFDLKPQTV
ncbi:MAG: UDP-N-acetylmuramoyl-tripeptide--D-alanyl-D-alanine ligase, partial [Deltaproteobacteria bacterium]|nr:UDP-N-acetylmuramoyl-tripeptide--D-alanyl-D-alanine ligase [Deltaproteobacteria bacterium]